MVGFSAQVQCWVAGGHPHPTLGPEVGPRGQGCSRQLLAAGAASGTSSWSQSRPAVAAGRQRSQAGSAAAAAAAINHSSGSSRRSAEHRGLGPAAAGRPAANAHDPNQALRQAQWLWLWHGRQGSCRAPPCWRVHVLRARGALGGRAAAAAPSWPSAGAPSMTVTVVRVGFRAKC